MTNRNKVSKGDPIIIPGAEHMSKEELEKAKRRESQRRLMQRRRGKEPTVRTTKQEARILDTKALTALTQETRDLAVTAVNRKLASILENPEQLEKANITQLATAYGILFDKAQLAAGLSTENISIHAKVDINMSADEAIKELNKLRERDSEDK
jgi:hypothetical protein